jgi:Tol biopolymer transport system component
MHHRLSRWLFILMSFALTLPWGGAFFWSASPAHASLPGRNRGFVFTSFKQPSGVSSSFLETINREGSARRVLEKCDYGCDYGAGDWSPDGRRLAYVDAFCPFECGLGPSIATVRADGSHRKVLFRPGQGCCVWSPAWSPDGRRIAFIKSRYYYGLGRGNVFIIHRDGTHLKRINTKHRAEYTLDWSSRNRLIVGARLRKQDDLFVMGHRGFYKRRLTNNHAIEAQPDWAPGGRRLVFVRVASSGDLFSAGQIWKMDAKGQDAASVAAGSSPAWAPNGSLIAFVVGKHDIHTVRPSGKDDNLLASPSHTGQISELDWRARL